MWLQWWWGKGQPVLLLHACRGLIFSMAICSGKVKREPWIWARTWSRAKTISSLALVFTPFSDLEVYQDSATASLNLITVIHEAVATWLWVWALHCHLAKPGRFHFLNCSSDTKLAQPPLVILVILPLNCLYFVSLFLAVTWNQAIFLPLFHNNTPARKRSSLPRREAAVQDFWAPCFSVPWSPTDSLAGLEQLKSISGASGPTLKGKEQSFFFLTCSGAKVCNSNPAELLTKTTPSKKKTPPPFCLLPINAF